MSATGRGKCAKIRREKNWFILFLQSCFIECVPNAKWDNITIVSKHSLLKKWNMYNNNNISTAIFSDTASTTHHWHWIHRKIFAHKLCWCAKMIFVSLLLHRTALHMFYSFSLMWAISCLFCFLFFIILVWFSFFFRKDQFNFSYAT